MGRNSMTLSRLFTFGIRVTKVWLKLAGISPIFKKERIAFDRSIPMLIEQRWHTIRPWSLQGRHLFESKIKFTFSKFHKKLLVHFFNDYPRNSLQHLRYMIWVGGSEQFLIIIYKQLSHLVIPFTPQTRVVS